MFSSSRRPGAPDPGFTLIELLVVMIIIGILAAIAIPVFLNQRASAKDTATKSDASNVAKDVTAYLVDPSGTLQMRVDPGTYLVSNQATPPSTCAAATGGTFCAEGKLSTGTTAPTTGALSANLSSASTWCVSLGNPDGRVKNFRITATSTLAAGTC